MKKRGGEQLKITTRGPLCSTCTGIHAPIYACVHMYVYTHTHTNTHLKGKVYPSKLILENV